MSVQVLFVAAEVRECEPFIHHWTDLSDPHLPLRWARSGLWKGRECVAVANGAGVDRARAAIAAVPQAMTVCSIGFCGAVDSSLAIGDVFVASEVRNGSGRWPALRPRGPAAAEGPLQTVHHIVGSSLEKKHLRATGCLVGEMEAAAVARASEEQGAAFYCVRAVSDLAGENFLNDFNACLKPDGSFDTVRLVRGALASPRRIAELVRLARRTSHAAKKLGEYLARCEF